MKQKQRALTFAAIATLLIGVPRSALLAGTITNDLVAHLTFDSNLNDSSGRGNHGAAVGTVPLVSGKVGANAMQFNSAADESSFNYVSLGAPPDLLFTDATDFSVAFWVKLGSWSGDPAFFSNKSWLNGGNPGYVIATAGDGHLQWNYREADNSRKDYDGPANTLSDGNWHHVTMVVERAGNIRAYLDGVEVDSRPARTPGEVPSSIDTDSLGNSVNIGQDGVGTYTDGNSVSVTNSLIDDLGVWRRPLSASEVFRVYDSGMKGVNLANVPDPTTPAITQASPTDGQTAVKGGVGVTVVIENGTTSLDPNSVKLSFDSAVVAHALSNSGKTNTVTYDPPGLLASGSIHSYQLVYADNGTPVTWKTNNATFTVGHYIDLTLPEPLSLETFDAVAEGEIPTGWVRSNLTSGATGAIDLNDPNSDSYLDWLVISHQRVLDIGALPTGGWDATERLMLPEQYVNGVLVQTLASNNFVYAESDQRNSVGQIQYLFTSDYNLTGKSNIYVSYWSTYEQNQDSLGAAEYSIDGGATWLPIVYMIASGDVLKDGSGTVDAFATLSTPYADVATWVDPNTFETLGGYYGAFIGVESNRWSTLGPYISGRIDDDSMESKRVELFRLTQADNQARVRFRFAQAGTASWYWGIDNLGLYSIATVSPPSATKPADQTAATGNTATFTTTVSGTEPVAIQWRFKNSDIANATNVTLVLNNVQPADAGEYTVKVTNVAGIFETQPATLTVITVTADVTGQWDFENGDLAATVGNPLEYFAPEVQTGTRFGTTASLGIPDIGGAVAKVMEVPELNPMGGYIMRHGASANGGGAYVNQYTLIVDLLFPDASAGKWLAFLQTATANSNDGDFFANTSGGIGISGNYQGKVNPNTWHRVAFAVDLAGPGPAPLVAKFIDGVKVGEQTLGEGRDGRWSLNSTSETANFALLFADNDGDNALMYVNSVQFRNGRLSDASIKALGGASAAGIPVPATAGPELTATKEGNNLLVSWPASATGYNLFSAPALPATTWTQVSGTPQTVGDRVVVTEAIGTGTKFYRLQKP